MTKVVLTADGACKGNPGPGGYCGIMRVGEHRCTTEGFIEHSTNSRSELMAIIAPLAKLTRPVELHIRSDSTYALQVLSNLEKWRISEGNFRTKKKVAANSDLLESLYQGLKLHKVTWEHVPGHNGDPDNEECDRRAKAQIVLNFLKGA